MYIGKLAELTGATRKAIRLYETLGLVPAPERKGRYRVYTENDVVLINMIRRAQRVGFKLSELKEIVSIKVRSKKFPFQMANDLIERKREELRRDMEEIRLRDRLLNELQGELKRKFSEFPECGV